MSTVETNYAAEFSGAVIAQIKAERAARDWSMQQLADASGLNLTSLSRYLNGKRELTMGTVAKLAGAFGMSVADLLRRADERIG